MGSYHTLSLGGLWLYLVASIPTDICTQIHQLIQLVCLNVVCIPTYNLLTIIQHNRCASRIVDYRSWSMMVEQCPNIVGIYDDWSLPHIIFQVVQHDKHKSTLCMYRFLTAGLDHQKPDARTDAEQHHRNTTILHKYTYFTRIRMCPYIPIYAYPVYMMYMAALCACRQRRNLSVLE